MGKSTIAETTLRMHRHHILPQKAPYLEELHEYRDDEEWIIGLTIEGHACQHDVLHKAFGWKGDKIAQDALLGQIGHEEATSQARADFITRNPNHHRKAGAKGGKAPCSRKSKEIATLWGQKIGSLFWWNNGNTNLRSMKSPGPEWVRGRFKKH